MSLDALTLLCYLGVEHSCTVADDLIGCAVTAKKQHDLELSTRFWTRFGHDLDTGTKNVGHAVLDMFWTRFASSANVATECPK